MEDRVKTRARRGEIKTALLQFIALGGIVTLAVAAPALVSGVPKHLVKKIFDRPRSARDAAISRLIAQGCLVRSKRKGVSILEVTNKGQNYLRLAAKKHREPIPRRWDKKWRVVIFDIKERNRGTRTRLRRELQSIGFKMLQASVWVYPYPCEDFVALLKADVHIGRDALYLVVEEMENDKHLRKYFSLL